MKQFTKLIEFRQAIYEHGLVCARDAQFELVDALLLSPVIRSFPELSLCPVFRRQWTSAYEAIRKGQQNQGWLERYFMRLVPTIGFHVFSLDGTAWPHPQAKVTEDLQYVHSPTPAIDGGNIVIGHPYSVLAWVPEIGRSWAPPMSVRRILSQQTAVEMGVAQVKQLCDERREEMIQFLHLIAADGAYGNHRFLGPLKKEPCGIVARLRRDRVLYGAPGPYSGRGRPRVHGDRFAFKEPETWWVSDAMGELEEAALKVKMGPEKKMKQADEDLKMTAYHEAGHAVVTNRLPKMDPVHRISIVARGASLGHTLIPPKTDRYTHTRSYFVNQITSLLGGRAAEKLIFDELTGGAASDITRATELARNMVVKMGMSKLGPINMGGGVDVGALGTNWYEPVKISEDLQSKADIEIKRIVDECSLKAMEILKKNKAKLDLVAKTLLEKETLESEDFEKLMG